MPPTPLTIDEIRRRKLPVVDSVKQALDFTMRHVGALLAVSWKWLLLVILPAFAAHAWFMLPINEAIWEGVRSVPPRPASPEMMVKVIASSALLNLVLLIPASSMAVNWHRFVLRGEPASSANGLRLDAPVWRYAGVALLMSAAVLVPQGLQVFAALYPSDFSIVLLLISFVAMFSFIFLFLRLWVVLPGVAVENSEANFATTFRATRRHTFRMVGGVLLILLPVVVATNIVMLPVTFIYGGKAATLVQAGLMLVYQLMAFVLLTFLSIAYRFFYEDGVARPGAPT